MKANARSVAVSVMAWLLAAACAWGVANVAYADEPTLTSGEIAQDESAPDGDDSTSAPDPDPDPEPAPEPEPEPVHPDGWEKSGSSWTYWKNNAQVKGKWVVTKTAPSIKGISKGEHRYWIDAKGNLARSRLINPAKKLDANAKYAAYATKYGYVATTGKTRVGDKLYLVKNDKGALATGNEQGFLSTKKYDNGTRRRYYINPKTHAVTMGKPVHVKGFGWVFAYPKKGYLLTGLKKVDATHVVLAEKNGKLRNRAGWVTTATYAGEKQRYYLEHTKKYKNLYGARIGKFKVDGSTYLGQSKGYVFRTGFKLLDGKYYYADRTGALYYQSVITNMYRKAQGYSSPSRYLIMVDVNDTKFIVFTGSQGNWKVQYIWDCSTGHPSTPTPIGVFHVGIKGYSFGHGYTCYYYTQFWGDYLIHTRIYQEGTHILMDAAMNTQVSQGCVRLYDEDAYWVYKNIPEGTTVVTIP